MQDSREGAMKDLRCMSYLGKDNALLIAAGCQNTMFKIDIEKGRVVEEVTNFKILGMGTLS